MATDGLTLRAALLVAGGAVIGALARWLMGGLLNRGFPYGILAVNVLGSFLIGVFAFGFLARHAAGEQARLFFAVGVLGSFTTMSSFAYDTIAMFDAREYGRAALNAIGNPLLCLLAAYAGRWVGLAWP